MTITESEVGFAMRNSCFAASIWRRFDRQAALFEDSLAVSILGTEIAARVTSTRIAITISRIVNPLDLLFRGALSMTLPFADDCGDFKKRASRHGDFGVLIRSK